MKNSTKIKILNLVKKLLNFKETELPGYGNTRFEIHELKFEASIDEPCQDIIHHPHVSIKFAETLLALRVLELEIKKIQDGYVVCGKMYYAEELKL